MVARYNADIRRQTVREERSETSPAAAPFSDQSLAYLRRNGAADSVTSDSSHVRLEARVILIISIISFKHNGTSAPDVRRG